MQDVFLGKRLMWTPGTPLRDDTTLKKRLRTPKRKKQPWIEVQDGGTSGLRGARPGVQVKLPVSLSGPTGGGAGATVAPVEVVQPGAGEFT